MLEKFREAIRRGKQFGTLLNDLSKAFDCIDHITLTAKLYEYGVSSSVLNIISSYLKHRTQQTKIKDFEKKLKIIYLPLVTKREEKLMLLGALPIICS